MKDSVVIVGAGQHMNVVIYNIREQNKYIPACILDINKDIWGTYIDGIYVEPNYEDYNKEYLNYIKNKYNTIKFFIAVGSMQLRKNLFSFFISSGWESVNIIHPKAIVSPDVVMGTGNLIECGCLITPSPIIGSNNVINTGSQVNHDNIIGDHVYIASGVVLSGGVKIGSNTLLDDGVIVTLGKEVGCNCIIGAGSVVTKNIPDNVIAYGSPCKIIRDNY